MLIGKTTVWHPAYGSKVHILHLPHNHSKTAWKKCRADSKNHIEVSKWYPAYRMVIRKRDYLG